MSYSGSQCERTVAGETALLLPTPSGRSTECVSVMGGRLAEILLRTQDTHVPNCPTLPLPDNHQQQIQRSRLRRMPSPDWSLAAGPPPPIPTLPLGHTDKGRDHCLTHLGKLSPIHKAWHSGRHSAKAYCTVHRSEGNTCR